MTPVVKATNSPLLHLNPPPGKLTNPLYGDVPAGTVPLKIGVLVEDAPLWYANVPDSVVAAMKNPLIHSAESLPKLDTAAVDAVV